ncbi:MAG: hydrolase 1, exosortase A system-associated [Burkholderiales bacterium]|nr:hydrolase 1, exosortase A system-associated [Burkholderiales bacterium]
MVRPLAFLIEGARAPLHATYFPPQGAPHPQGDILVVPPFAEEMNRCRAMVALQARELSRCGVGTLVLDPYGTGDSAGDFVDATWTLWLADLRAGLAWLREHGQGCRTLWGLRLGAVLASHLARADGAIDRLLLWQPVLDGKQFFTQFLRIRIAAEMNLPDRVKTTGELRKRAADGEAIEVSGYRIGPPLAKQLDEAQFDASVLASPMRIDWFEVLQAADATMSPAARQAIDRWRLAGASVEAGIVIGPAFWHVHERELAPGLIAATAARVRAWGGPGASRGDMAPPAHAPHAELPVFFDCGADHLSGVLHHAAPDASCGVVIVVAGGPQYRAGAHRQFVTLARRLAASGFPVLRFDLRGMGDSSGEHRGYGQSESDIRAAIDSLLSAQPQLRGVALLGECESASGILFYAWRDPRVKRTVLINPWVRTEEGRAQVIVRHYYLHRLGSADFWKQVFSGQFRAAESLRSLFGVVRAYVRGRIEMARQSAEPGLDDFSHLPLPVRVAEGLRRFQGRSLLLMSGFDLIAREFDEVTSASRAWAGLLAGERIRRVDIEGADHTFSREVWKNAAADTVARWLEVDAGGPTAAA